jgi:hypothetical protein
MTVAELIRVLSGMPADAPVVVCTGDAACYHVRSVAHFGSGELEVDDGDGRYALQQGVQLDTTG